jgi:hypothetical protein
MPDAMPLRIILSKYSPAPSAISRHKKADWPYPAFAGAIAQAWRNPSRPIHAMLRRHGKQALKPLNAGGSSRPDDH